MRISSLSSSSSLFVVLLSSSGLAWAQVTPGRLRHRSRRRRPSPEPSPSPSPSPEATPPATRRSRRGGGAGGPSGPLPVYGPASSKVFNPDIAVIGNFLGAAGSNDADRAPPSLEMHEVEATFQAVVDPYARADFFLAFGREEAEIEEGFITFPSLPAELPAEGRARCGPPSARSTRCTTTCCPGPTGRS